MSEKIIFSPVKKGFTTRWNILSQIKSQGSDNLRSIDLQLTSSLEDRITFLLPFASETFIHHFTQLRRRGLTRFQIAQELIKSLISGTFGKFEDFEILSFGIELILTIVTNGKFSPRQSPFETSIEGERKHLKVLFYSKYILDISPKTIVEIVILIEILTQNILLSSSNRFNVTKEDIQNILNDCRVYHPSSLWDNEEESISRFLGLISFEIDTDSYGTHQIIYPDTQSPSSGKLRPGLSHILFSLFSEKTYFLQLIKSVILSKWYFIFEPTSQHRKPNQIKIPFLMENLIVSPTYSPLADEKSLGGFELYFGKTQNTGNDIVGVSPHLFELFSILRPGSQIKLEGRTFPLSIAPVEILPAPLVILKTKELVRFDSNIEKINVLKIHSLGGILIDPLIIDDFNQELKIVNDWEKWLEQVVRIQFPEGILIDNNLKLLNNKLSALYLKKHSTKDSNIIEYLISNNLPILYVLLPKWKTLLIKQLKNLIDNIITNDFSKKDEIALNYDDEIIKLLYEGHIPFHIEEQKILVEDYKKMFEILKKLSHSHRELIYNVKNENKSMNFYKFLKENLNIALSHRNPFLGAISTINWHPLLLQDSPKKFGVITRDQLKSIPESDLNIENFYLNESSPGELIKKSILRRKHNISLFSSPVFSFSLPNARLTHFKSEDIGITLEKLKELGYRVDRDGKALKSKDQVLPIFLNDILIPKSIFNTLKRIYDFLDDELTSIYGENAIFNIKSPNDLIGNFLVGCNPNYSTGTLGRVIGWSDTKFNSDCLMAHPLWHGSKYSTCRNDEPDFLYILEDLILNFNLSLLSPKINSLLGKPIFIKETISEDDISVDLEYSLDKEHGKNFELSFLPRKDIFISSYNILIDFYNSLDSKHHFLTFKKTLEQANSKFNKQMPLELTPTDFNLIENNFNLFSSFYFGNMEFIKKLYFNALIFPRFNAQLDLWLEQSIECPKCNSPYPYAIFRNCPSCNNPLELVYDKIPIMNQYEFIKDLMKKYPSQSLDESFYYLKNQFKLLFPAEEKMVEPG